MRSRWLLLTAGAYGLALALIGLWPTPVDRSLAVVQWPPVMSLGEVLGLNPYETYNLVEFTSNIVLFVPFGALLVLWGADRGRLRAVLATVAAFAASTAIEVLQEALRPERFASLTDVVANTLGGAIGALLALATRAAIRRSVRPSGRRR